MADDKVVKSAYELAMERFKKQDKEAGIERRRMFITRSSRMQPRDDYSEL